MASLCVFLFYIFRRIAARKLRRSHIKRFGRLMQHHQGTLINEFETWFPSISLQKTRNPDFSVSSSSGWNPSWELRVASPHAHGNFTTKYCPLTPATSTVSSNVIPKSLERHLRALSSSLPHSQP
jgi:hypothetical protein